MSEEQITQPADDFIVVNGKKEPIIRKSYTYDEIVMLAFPGHVTGEAMAYTVAYRNGPTENPSGTMVQGSHVLVGPKMIFDVTSTHKS